MSSNPFTYGNPISDPRRFIGRQREVEQVFSRLRNAEAESSSLVGERRVGKTSLLHYIAHPDVRRRFGLDSPEFLFIYVDLQMVDAATTPARLAQRLLHQMAQQCPDANVKKTIQDASALGTIDNFALADLFDVVDQAGLHIVFLLDEFENVTTNTNFGPDFFYGLRSLAIQHNLSLVTSSRSELIELCHSEAIRSSPFFNIFANINLRLFTDVEARELISTSLTGSGVDFTPDEIDTILRLAGNHPLFLQAACYFLFAAYADHLDAPERNKFLVKEYREEAAPHLDDYWHNSLDHEKIVLTALALLERQGKAGKRAFRVDQLQELYSHSEQTLAHLEKRGLLVSKEDGYALFNTYFGDWILREISNPTSDPRSYEEWLKSNQGVMERLSTRAGSEIGDILPRISTKYRDLIVAWISDPKNLIALAALFRTLPALL
jgi:hypothetical protein